MPPLLLGTGLMIGLLWVAMALGRRLLRFLRLEIADPAEQVVFAAGLGFGALQFVPFTLFALGIGQPWVFRITLAVLALVLIPDGLGILRVAWAGRRNRLPLAWWQWVMLVAFAFLLGVLYLRALCPPTDCDGLVYHLTAPVRYLRAGRFVYLPTLTYTNWPLGIEVLFSLPLALDPMGPVGLIQYMLGTLTLAAIYLYGRRLGGPFVGATAACLLMVSTDFWWEMVAAYIDVGTAMFATLAIFAYARGNEDLDQSRAWLRLTALFAGLVATTKLNCILIIDTFPLLILGMGPGGKLARWRQALQFVLLAVCPVIPWIVRTWVMTGNPLYPGFQGLFGGRELTAEGWERFHRMHLLYDAVPGLPPTARVLLATHAAFGIGAMLVALVVVRLTRNSRVALPAAFAGLFAASIISASYYNMRFLLAVQPSAALCVAFLFRGRQRLIAPLVCVLAVIGAIHLAEHAGGPDLPTAFRVACGQMGPGPYWHSRLAEYPIVEFANQNLPPDTNLLVSTWEPETALYACAALSANYWLQDCIHYDTEERLQADLRRLGISYLVLAPFPAWCDHSLVAGPRKHIEGPALATLARRFGTRLCEANGVSLYRLNLPPGGPSVAERKNP